MYYNTRNFRVFSGGYAFLNIHVLAKIRHPEEVRTS
jgi:hypothetical protein